MSTNIFLGYPPENIKQFIIENYGQKDSGPLCFTANNPDENANVSLKCMFYGDY
jgi:hypothetical protein